VGVRDELLKISNLNTDDIYTLYTCVKSFIEYSIAIHNDNVTLHSKSYSIADGHIYQHFVDCYNYTISERIQEIFTSGDTFKRLTICEGGIVAKQSTDLYDVTILSVQEDSLKVTGTLEGGKVSTKVVTPQELGYTYKHPNDSYRSYTTTQIESHLLENFNFPEKLDFLTLPLEKLFEKYHYYIMECYSMYSSEHHFLDDFGSGFLITKEHTEVIHKIVREIITNVKGSLLERI
jgi:hypothetical protein